MFKNNSAESEISYIRQQIEKVAEREKTLRKIMSSPVGSFGMNEVIKLIIEETGRLFKADRCFFIEFDPTTDTNFPMTANAEYRSSKAIRSHLTRQANAEEVKTFLIETKQKKISFVEDTEKANLEEAPRRMLIDDLSVKSYLIIPVFFGEIMHGSLVLHYVNNYMKFNKDDIEVAQAIANQSAIVIHQAKLYDELKQTMAKQNAILNNMPFMAWTKDIDSKYIAVNKQFCENHRIKADYIIGKTDYDISSKELAEKYRQDDAQVIKTGKLKITEENIKTKDGIGWAETYKSPFFDDKGNVLGTVGFAKDITEKKEAEIELLNKQDQIIKAAEREKIVANIISKAVNSFDISQINQIVNEIGIITKADRCYFVQADALNETQGKPVENDAEYLSSSEIKSIKGYEFLSDDVRTFIEILSKTKDLIVYDFEIIHNEQSEKYSSIKRYGNLFGVKSSIGIPLFYNGKLKAIFAIEYVKEKMIPSEDDLSFLRILGKQIELAFNQIQLYQDAKAAAQREKLIREIVSEISSTLNPNKIRKILVDNLGTALDSDLDIIYVKDSKTEKFLPVDEYSVHVSSEEIKNPIGVNVIEDYEWEIYIRNNKKAEVIYSDIEELKRDYNLHGTKTEEFLNLYKIKSMIAIPIIYAKTFLGFLVLNFIKRQRTFTEEEINLIKVLANQAAIALYQTNLYNQTQEASRAKSEFIANMSHEIKTPLSIIIGFSELLSKSKVDPHKQLNYLNNINMSGKHLLNLTNDIINISKIESGIFELNYEDCDSKSVIIDAVDSIRLMAKDKHINIDVDTTRAAVKADRKMLTQIMYNILTNAIKFTPKNGHIKIKSELDNNNLIVTIKDDGIGIKTSDQSTIFEKFMQVDSSFERTQPGAGLGLAITKELVELHNGSIYVKSTKDEGSSFWFVLPNASKMD